MARPVVVLPQPDSPTRLERLARVHGEADAVDGLHRRRSCGAGCRSGSGKCTCRSSTTSSGIARRHRRGGIARHRDDFGAEAARRRPPRRSGRRPRCRRDGPQRRVLRRAAGTVAADGAARMEGAARRRGAPGRRLAGDRIEPRLGALRDAACSSAAPRCRDGAAAGRSPRPARSRRCGRHTSPRRDGRLRRRRRDRA